MAVTSEVIRYVKLCTKDDQHRMIEPKTTARVERTGQPERMIEFGPG